MNLQEQFATALSEAQKALEAGDLEAGKTWKAKAVAAKEAIDELDAISALRNSAAPQPMRIDLPGTDGKTIIAKAPAEVKDNRPPFKTAGEFLLTVARATQHNYRDNRLDDIKSNDPLDEGGFDVTKALGPKFLHGESSKAPLGLNTGVFSEGGFLVDTDRQPGILSRMYETGQLLQRIDMVGVSANSNGMTFYAEDETSRANGSRRGGIVAYWRGEGLSVTAGKPAFREMELKLRSIMGLCYATDEMLSDAPALESYIQNNLPDELRFKVENAIVNGTGAGQPAGFMGSALVTVAKETGQAADTIVSENIWKMYSRMWAPSISQSVWLISQDVWPQLFGLHVTVGTGGSTLFQPPGGISAAPYGTLMGRPVLPVEYCAKLGDLGDIVFADLKQYQMISKGGIRSDSSMHVNFTTADNCFRFIWRVDGQSKWNSVLTPYNGGADLSPFVTLAAR
jgi:HK97 family phage major capsid protein